ncbi:MAG: glycosyltransferase [Bacteroidetes bacterium]|nr:glycosyltransferase [Bacteroidota bacterium]
MKKEPEISIRVITYNHEKYISKCLDGIVRQITDIPYEIIIGDDASDDNTLKICDSYKRRYDNIDFIIISNPSNIGAQENGKRALASCRGKYIALCEGDDYWCDDHKLQIQYNYLEKHPEIIISGHDAFIVDSDDNIIKESKLPDQYKRDYSSEELILGKAWILSMSWMFRRVDINNIPERRMILNGDTFLLSVLGQYGGSHYHKDIKPAAYRVHESSVWSSLSQKEKNISEINTWFWISRYYQRIGSVAYFKYYWLKYLKSVFDATNIIDLSVVYLKSILSIKRIKRLTLYIFRIQSK